MQQDLPHSGSSVWVPHQSVLHFFSANGKPELVSVFIEMQVMDPVAMMAIFKGGLGYCAHRLHPGRLLGNPWAACCSGA